MTTQPAKRQKLNEVTRQTNAKERHTKAPAGTVLRHKLDRAKEKARKKRFARLSKNQVNKADGFASAVFDHGASGHLFYVLAAVLDEAQRTAERTGGRSIEFASTYAALRWLDLGLGGSQRRALWRVLQLGEKISFRFARWDRGIQQKPRYRKRKFDRVWTVKKKKSGAILITFDRQFWRSNKPKKRFVPFRPEIVRELRYPHIILLSLLVEAFNHRLRMDQDVLAAKIALTDTNPRRLRKSIIAAVKRVSAVTGEPLECRIRRKRQIEIRPAVAEIDPLEELRGSMNPEDFRVGVASVDTQRKSKTLDARLKAGVRDLIIKGVFQPLPPSPEDAG